MNKFFRLKKLDVFIKRSLNIVNFKNLFKRCLFNFKKVTLMRKNFFKKLKNFLALKLKKVYMNYTYNKNFFRFLLYPLLSMVIYKPLCSVIPFFFNFTTVLNKFKFRRLLKFKRKVYNRFKIRFNKIKSNFIAVNATVKCSLFFFVILKILRKIFMLPLQSLLKRNYIYRKKLKLFRLGHKRILYVFKRFNRIIKKYRMKKMVILKKILTKTKRRF